MASAVTHSRIHAAASKMLKKAVLKCDEGDFYEAHQLYRTVYARSVRNILAPYHKTILVYCISFSIFRVKGTGHDVFY